jgi:hypothetical protein
MDFEVWWLALSGGGAAFNCHPLPNGDVAWQAVAGADALAAQGLEFDAAKGRVVEVAGWGGGSAAAGTPTGLLSPVTLRSPLRAAVAAALGGGHEGAGAAAAEPPAGPLTPWVSESEAPRAWSCVKLPCMRPSL